MRDATNAALLAVIVVLVIALFYAILKDPPE